MFNQYEPNVKATIAFLRMLKVSVNNATVNETLQNHPDWPGLLCISDALHKWNIPNGAGKIDTNKIDELPVPFLAYTYDRESPLTIVTHFSGTAISSFQKNYPKSITENKEDFLKKWKGVYLIAEPNENSGEPNFEANKTKAFFNSLIPAQGPQWQREAVPTDPRLPHQDQGSGQHHLGLERPGFHLAQC